MFQGPSIMFVIKYFGKDFRNNRLWIFTPRTPEQVYMRGDAELAAPPYLGSSRAGTAIFGVVQSRICPIWVIWSRIHPVLGRLEPVPPYLGSSRAGFPLYGTSEPDPPYMGRLMPDPPYLRSSGTGTPSMGRLEPDPPYLELALPYLGLSRAGFPLMGRPEPGLLHWFHYLRLRNMDYLLYDFRV